MKTAIVSILFTVALLASCTKITESGTRGSGNTRSETRNVSGFKKIKADNAFKLEVTAQKPFSVVVAADDNILPLITSEVKDDTLVISLKGSVTAKATMTVTISLPELTGVEAMGATVGTISGIKTDKFEISAVGASRLKCDGEIKDLKAKAVGASEIDCEGLKAEKAEVDSVGASTVIVNASDHLNAKASGASTVNYIGEPRQLEQAATDISTIKKK